MFVLCIVQLDRYVIRGVGHNSNFLRDVYVAPRFVEGRLTTGYIAEEYPDGFSGVEVTSRLAERMAAIAAVMSSVQYVELRCDSFPPSVVFAFVAVVWFLAFLRIASA